MRNHYFSIPILIILSTAITVFRAFVRYTDAMTVSKHVHDRGQSGCDEALQGPSGSPNEVRSGAGGKSLGYDETHGKWAEGYSPQTQPQHLQTLEPPENPSRKPYAAGTRNSKQTDKGQKLSSILPHR